MRGAARFPNAKQRLLTEDGYDKHPGSDKEDTAVS
jgi:hypothetical protein